MSASQAYDYIGPPEAHLCLAQLAVYLSAAPKSNALYRAEKLVKQVIRSGQEPSVPFHLRNAPTGLMRELGYGHEYRYPHDFKGSFVDENYFPEGLENSKFYKPTENGKEKHTAERLRTLWPKRGINSKD
jgi:putative ATPase